MKGNTTQCRPVFLLSDAFVKNYEIKRPRIFKDPDLTPVEEINHSVLAIKFSNNLTKDMIFSGLRDIFKKIGDFIYRGYEIEIPFTFGTLTSKERRVKFEFNQQRLQDVSVTSLFAVQIVMLFTIMFSFYRSYPTVFLREY